jgi:hypothetical protein
MNDSHNQEPDKHFLEHVDGLRDALEHRQKRYRFMRSIKIAGIVAAVLLVGAYLGLKKQSSVSERLQANDENNSVQLASTGERQHHIKDQSPALVAEIQKDLAVSPAKERPHDSASYQTGSASHLQKPILNETVNAAEPMTSSSENRKDSASQSPRKAESESAAGEAISEISNLAAAGQIADLRETFIQPVTKTSPEIADSNVATSVDASSKETSHQRPENKKPLDTTVTFADEPKQTSTPSRQNFYVYETVVCRKVVNRQWLQETNRFSIRRGDKPHVWMDIRSKSLPFTMKHIYYHNDKKYCEVPLEITYPRMRTWSRINLIDNISDGVWRVEVVSADGVVVAERRFEVIP